MYVGALVIDFRARTKNDAKPLAQSSYNSIVYRDEDAATLLLTIGFDSIGQEYSRQGIGSVQ